jgi:glycine cleavage system regulatory protein
MSASVVLSVISDDHPGIVESLSEVLAAHGGNWTESSMMSLAGKFAGILLASLPDQSMEGFFADLRKLEDEGLRVIAQRTTDEPRPGGGREFTLDLIGQDRPGIVHDITRILAAHRVNVKEIDTHCQSASMSGEKLFLANARVQIPADAELDGLREELEELANELMVDIKLGE